MEKEAGLTMADGHTIRGKWSASGVPHKGWHCVSVDDLEEPSQECEMCESVDIRYVHYMEHPDYPETLAVGCICAEHMENDYVRPREREAGLRRLSRRRTSWGKREWRLSRHGNLYLNTEGFNLTVFQRGTGFGVSVARRDRDGSQMGKKNYSTQEDAKAAALNALIWAKAHL